MSNEISNLATALVVAQQAVQAVEKTGVDDFIKKNGKGRKYALMEDLIAEGARALNVAGISARVIKTAFVAGSPSFLIIFTKITHGASGESEEHEHVMPVVEGSGKPLDKAIATARTYAIGYYFRDLLNMPRVEEGTDVDQRDDRNHALTQTKVRKVPGIVEKADSDIAENLQATLVGTLIKKISEAPDMDTLKNVANDIKKVGSLDAEAKTYLQEIYLSKRTEIANGGAA